MRWILVDKLIECDPGVSAKAVKNFSRSDVFFMDHFPNYPVVPGVLQIEMIAQAGGKSLRLARPDSLPMLATVKSAKFSRSIEPGDQCIISVQITKFAKDYATATGIIEVDGKKVSEAEIMYAIRPGVLGSVSSDGVLNDWKKRQGLNHE